MTSNAFLGQCLRFRDSAGSSASFSSVGSFVLGCPDMSGALGDTCLLSKIVASVIASGVGMGVMSVS